MQSEIKQFTARLKTFTRKTLGSEHTRKAFSQEGEDLILRRLFETKESGFYVDVGAHHPQRFSNTYLFYRMGWRGINVDAMPGSMEPFQKLRPRDININAAIANQEKQLTFFVFNEPAINSFDEALSRSRVNSQYQIIEEIPVRTRTLKSILEQHLPPATAIDFLSVDVEGLDLEVLQSNDWEQFRPRAVLVECPGPYIEDVKQDPAYLFLTKLGYKAFAKTFYTVVFVDPQAIHL